MSVVLLLVLPAPELGLEGATDIARVTQQVLFATRHSRCNTETAEFSLDSVREASKHTVGVTRKVTRALATQRNRLYAT